MRIGSSQDSVASQIRNAAAMIAGEISQMTAFFIRERKARLMQEHSSALAGVRLVIDAPAHIVNDGCQPEQTKIRGNQAVILVSQAKQSVGDPADAILVTDLSKAALHPPAHGQMFRRSVLADLQHLACLHAMPAALSSLPAGRLSRHLIDRSVLPFKSAQEAVRLTNPA